MGSDSGEQTEEILDPEAILMTTQTSSESTDLRVPGGAPGTESNLPRDPADPDSAPREVARRRLQRLLLFREPEIHNVLLGRLPLTALRQPPTR